MCGEEELDLMATAQELKHLTQHESNWLVGLVRLLERLFIDKHRLRKTVTHEIVSAVGRGSLYNQRPRPAFCNVPLSLVSVAMFRLNNTLDYYILTKICI